MYGSICLQLLEWPNKYLEKIIIKFQWINKSQEQANAEVRWCIWQDFRLDFHLIKPSPRPISGEFPVVSFHTHQILIGLVHLSKTYEAFLPSGRKAQRFNVSVKTNCPSHPQTKWTSRVRQHSFQRLQFEPKPNIVDLPKIAIWFPVSA